MAMEIAIVGIGMRSALGLDAVQTATSVRAGLSGFAETAFLDQRLEPFIGAFLPQEDLPPLADTVTDAVSFTNRERRLIVLGGAPLKAALEDVGDSVGPVPVVLGVPGKDRTFRLTDTEMLGALAAQCGAEIDLSGSSAILKGRAAGLLAVHEACEGLRNGRYEVVVAGGVDTYRDPLILGQLDRDARISSSVNRDGFIPGEGAGYLVLTERRTADTRGWPVRAVLTSTAAGFEDGHWGSELTYTGDGLAETFRALFASRATTAPVIATVCAGFNGESHWAKEWGVSQIRHHQRFASDFDIEHPADCIGDTGAACGPLMAAMAVIGMQGGYRRSPVLIFAASDSGDRVAAIMEGTTSRE